MLRLGNIGGPVARIGRAFGMRVMAWSQNLTADIATAAGASLVTKSELFRLADFVTIHLVLSTRTTGLVGASGIESHETDGYPHQHLARPDRR